LKRQPIIILNLLVKNHAKSSLAWFFDVGG
jgi:hypothetical protein